MGPIAKSLDELQKEQNCYLGGVLPCLTKLLHIFSNIENNLVRPLKEAMLAGLHKRFDQYFENEEFIIAACVHPKFKLSWLENSKTTVNGTEKRTIEARHIVESALRKPPTNHSSTESGNESEHDWLSFEDSAASNHSTFQNFILDPDKSLDSLKKHPEIKSLFIRYNTPIPSSATVERMFSLANLLLTAKRNSLGGELFEMLLMLKINSHVSGWNKK